MIQKNFRFKNLQAAINGIDILRETIKDIPHRDLLINIFLSKINEKECRKILMEFGNKIENCKHIGISVYNFFGDKDKELIEFNIILSNNTDFYILEIPCLPERELQAAAECRNQLSKIPNVQGIEIFSVNTGLDLTKFLNALSLGYEEIPIFGAVARPDTEIGNSFAIGDTLIFSGFTLAIFSSEDLHIYMDYILGWNPIGKEMSITLGEKKENSECAISLIDGQPAVSIYEKYLGVC